MKLIIDIPEYEYRLIKEVYEKNDNVESTYSYIYHGEPLKEQSTDAIDKRSLDSVIDTLQTWIKTTDDEYDREEYWRVTGLREALQEIKKIKTFESSTNVVDRDAVINLVKYSLCDLKRDADKQIFINTINSLPSAQSQPCEDCISRESMLSLQTEYAEKMGATTFWKLRDDIRKLPSVTPQRPKGKWIHPYKSDIACECSECHIQMPITNYYHYCPNCGAEMSEDRNKQNL